MGLIQPLKAQTKQLCMREYEPSFKANYDEIKLRKSFDHFVQQGSGAAEPGKALPIVYCSVAASLPWFDSEYSPPYVPSSNYAFARMFTDKQAPICGA